MENAPGILQPEEQACADQPEKSRSVPRICHAESKTVFTITITVPGHFSDRIFFVTPVVARFFSLLSVINIDSLFVCLSVALLSFILLLCSGKLPLRRAEIMGIKKINRHRRKPIPVCNCCGHFTLVCSRSSSMRKLFHGVRRYDVWHSFFLYHLNKSS